MIGVLPGSPPASAAPGAAGLTDSAVTVPGSGEFAGLRVTVGQTRNLINQVVTVSWTGGLPTRPSTGQFGINYLQIMQCWGDDPQGPDRTQCQYGVSIALLPETGAWVRSRQVTYPFVDPKEALQPPTDSDIAAVPFWPVGRDKPTGSVTGAKVVRLKSPNPMIAGEVRPVFARMGLLASQLAADAATAIEHRGSAVQ